MGKDRVADINRLRDRKKQLEARIQQLENKKANEERRKDTRRKILAGAYLIKLLGGDLQRVGKKLEDASFLKPKDRDLFFGNS